MAIFYNTYMGEENFSKYLWTAGSHLFENIFQVLDLHGAFKSGEQIPLFVVHGQVGHETDIIKNRKRVFNILAHSDVIKPLEVIFFIKRFHGIEGHHGGHYDLDIFELVNILNDLFSFMLAMFAIRIKENEQDRLVFFEIAFCEITAAVNL